MSIDEILATAKQIGKRYTNNWRRLGIPWYDHRYDWARGPENWMWLERGILGHHYIREGDRVLDLCCGDGMFSGLVFSKKASMVHGVDRNSQAITLARELYTRSNVEFFERDILTDEFPAPEYDTVLFYQALEHFTHKQIDCLLNKITATLAPDGILFGSTILLGINHNDEHAVEFTCVEEVKRLLALHFKHVITWTTIWKKTRTEVYFLCSQNEIEGKNGGRNGH